MQYPIVQLSELKPGNVFTGIGTPLAVKVKQNISVPEICAVVRIDAYYPMALDAKVFTVCKIEDIDSLIGLTLVGPESQPLKDVESGMVCMTGHPFGLVQMILATNAVSFTGRIVAALGPGDGFDAELSVEDLGYGGEYPGTEKRRVRTCPNCNMVSLYEVDETPPSGYHIVCVCKNCYSKVAIGWKQ